MNDILKNNLDNLCGSFRNSVSASEKIFKELTNMNLSPEEKAEAGKYIREVMLSKRKRPDIDVKKILLDIQDVINLSYIAKHYFSRDRTWLYHRINGTLINNKPAAFTEQELSILSTALQEVAKKIIDTSSLLKSNL